MGGWVGDFRDMRSHSSCLKGVASSTIEGQRGEQRAAGGDRTSVAGKEWKGVSRASICKAFLSKPHASNNQFRSSSGPLPTMA